MALFKCKMCGGALEIGSNETVATCEYCGTQQTLPKLDDDKRANMYDRANHFRRNNEFDKAMSVYEKILNEDNTDAEAYWSLVLCRYGIEYVEDPSSHKRVPTVNRAQFTSIFEDDNYKSALQHADGYQKVIYEEEARAINEIQKGILAISQKEEPFDVFICYKETDNSGRRTPDSVLANDLYHQLTQEGFKVFFARITLEDKLGSAYEPYIFAALNSAKVMVVLGTKPEFFNAVWVKNEWSRYLALIKNGAKKMLIPAYKDMDPYDLPEEFSHLQAQDMSKLGFMQDLIRGVKKIVGSSDSKATVIKETVVTGGNANIESLIKRIYMFLDDGDWKSANEYCEKVLDIEPENVSAYLGKLLAEQKVRNKAGLVNCKEPFDSNPNYLKVTRFGDQALKNELLGYIDSINKRNEAERIERVYQNGLNLMEKDRPDMYLKAAELFASIPDYKDSTSLVVECKEKAEAKRKDIIYDEAKAMMTGEDTKNYESAIHSFEKIPGWRDSYEQIDICKRKIEDIKRKEEEARLAAKRKAEAERAEKERLAKEKKKKIIITISTIAAIIVAIIVIVNISNYIKYKPLSDAFSNNEVNAEYIKTHHSNLQYDKGALKVFEKELEKCHRNNDLKKAIEILTILAKTDVVFDYEEYDDAGNDTEFNPHISAWWSFTDWLYAEARSSGNQIPTEDYDGYIDETYAVFDYKISFRENVNGEIYGAAIYVDSVGWYELSASKNTASNRSFHSKRGGVMVD